MSGNTIISNYYDSLVRQIDEYIDEKLKKYNREDEIKIGELKKNQPESVKFDIDTSNDLLSDDTERNVFTEPDNNLGNVTADLAGVSLKSRPFKKLARQYLNEMRDEMMSEVRRLSKQTIDELDQRNENDETDERKIFGSRFGLVFFRSNSESVDEPAPCEVYLLVLDFYLDEFQRKFLNLLLRGTYENTETKNFLASLGPKIPINQSTFLSVLVAKHVMDVFERFGLNHSVIKVSKQQNLNSIETLRIPINLDRFGGARFHVDLDGSEQLDFPNIKYLDIGIFRDDLSVASLKSLRGLKSLSLQKCSFEKNTLEGLNNLRKLLIDDCSLENLKSESFKSLDNLEYLKIITPLFDSDNFQLEIKREFPRLKWLHLSKVLVSEKMMNIFSGHQLRVLKLNQCKIESTEFLAEIPRLRALRMYECLSTEKLRLPRSLNRLEFISICSDYGDKLSLDESFLKFESLKSIDLHNTEISLRENKFESLGKLETLRITLKDEEGQLGKDLFRGLDNLVDLDLDFDDSFTFQSEMFTNLPRLSSLRLRPSSFEVRPETFKYLKHLKSLNMQNIMMSGLEDNIFRPLISLESLNLENTFLEKIEDQAFAGLGELRELNLSGNRFETISSRVFLPLKKLTKLNLTYSVRTCELNGLFTSLVSLESLDMSSNDLKSIDSGVFQGLGLLRELNLRSNWIEKLEAESFGELKELRELNLSENKIEIVETGTFGRLAKLEELNLNGNQIKKLEKNSFDGLVSLKKLYFANPVENLSLEMFMGMEPHLECLMVDSQFEENFEDKAIEFKKFFGTKLSISAIIY